MDRLRAYNRGMGGRGFICGSLQYSKIPLAADAAWIKWIRLVLWCFNLATLVLHLAKLWNMIISFKQLFFWNLFGLRVTCEISAWPGTAQVLWSQDLSDYRSVCASLKGAELVNNDLTKFSLYVLVSIDCFLYQHPDFCAVSSYKDRHKCLAPLCSVCCVLAKWK